MQHIENDDGAIRGLLMAPVPVHRRVRLVLHLDVIPRHACEPRRRVRPHVREGPRRGSSWVQLGYDVLDGHVASSGRGRVVGNEVVPGGEVLADEDED